MVVWTLNSYVSVTRIWKRKIIVGAELMPVYWKKSSFVFCNVIIVEPVFGFKRSEQVTIYEIWLVAACIQDRHSRARCTVVVLGISTNECRNEYYGSPVLCLGAENPFFFSRILRHAREGLGCKHILRRLAWWACRALSSQHSKWQQFNTLSLVLLNVSAIEGM